MHLECDHIVSAVFEKFSCFIYLIKSDWYSCFFKFSDEYKLNLWIKIETEKTTFYNLTLSIKNNFVFL